MKAPLSLLLINPGWLADATDVPNGSLGLPLQQDREFSSRSKDNFRNDLDFVFFFSQQLNTISRINGTETAVKGNWTQQDIRRTTQIARLIGIKQGNDNWTGTGGTLFSPPPAITHFGTGDNQGELLVSLVRYALY